MTTPRFHVFVCTHRRSEGHPRGSCGAKGGEKVFDAFAQALIRRNAQNRIALTSTNCLGPCNAGANVLIYPGSIMYSWVEAEDAERIVQDHLLEGKPWTEKLTPAELW
ncbi:(2Fe-2S) ferredoxin domain-containing protein [Pseudomonas sp. Pseusp122]|uniref:(2Fe-2S) ferredoxin domain-containing protein n=1 Tax=unclassified Pseudomonas TaxID=196821 RepID=UPI0039A5D10A